MCRLDEDIFPRYSPTSGNVAQTGTSPGNLTLRTVPTFLCIDPEPLAREGRAAG